MIELALATAAIAMIVTKSRLFRALQFCYMTRCPVCFATWTAIFLVFATYEGNTFDLVILSFGVMALSAVPMIWLNYLMEKVDEEVHDSESGSL